MKFLNLIIVLFLLSSCKENTISIDNIAPEDIVEDSVINLNSLMTWTDDTIINTNNTLVELMDTLYQHVRSDSFCAENVESNLKWMRDYRNKLCRYYDKHKLTRDSISPFTKADAVIAEARRLWEMDRDYSTMGMIVSFGTEWTRLIFEEYNELERLLEICETPKERTVLLQEYHTWLNLKKAFIAIYDNCMEMYYWGGSATGPLRGAGINDIMVSHISLYRNDRNMIRSEQFERNGVFVECAKDLLLNCCNKVYDTAVEGWDGEDVSEYLNEMKTETPFLIADFPKVIDEWINARELWIEEMSTDALRNSYRQNSGKLLVDLSVILSNIPY